MLPADNPAFEQVFTPTGLHGIDTPGIRNSRRAQPPQQHRSRPLTRFAEHVQTQLFLMLRGQGIALAAVGRARSARTRRPRACIGRWIGARQLQCRQFLLDRDRQPAARCLRCHSALTITDQYRFGRRRDRTTAAKRIALHQARLQRFDQLTAARMREPAQPRQIAHHPDRLGGVGCSRHMPLAPQLATDVGHQFRHRTLHRGPISGLQHPLVPHRIENAGWITAPLVELGEGIRDQRHADLFLPCPGPGFRRLQQSLVLLSLRQEHFGQQRRSMKGTDHSYRFRAGSADRLPHRRFPQSIAAVARWRRRPHRPAERQRCPTNRFGIRIDARRLDQPLPQVTGIAGAAVTQPTFQQAFLIEV